MAAPADDDHIQSFHGGQIMMARPLSSSRVLLDMPPLQGPSAGRGVGSYATGLLAGLIAGGFDSNLTLLLDAVRDEPTLPPGPYEPAAPRRPHQRPLHGYPDTAA